MNYLEGKIDFNGQIRCAKYMNYGILMSGVGAYIAGWFAQDSYLSIIVFFILAAVVGIICIPAWPMYNRKPLQFQKAKK
ncbi:microsomal signal peptidase 12 kDa subunit [Schizosaccharomyces cryophilus OY26]|uniref:Signal peptidase complex subunit 1 n=1 Tax=Schizosaccharomyces cryophilus (strain OY26 / ATCC MYA-4695 / CBS 11777 / NBRC 106824 / NRRL Y48691) TaxID=653667 RepID=S9XJD8_SCHCR|nr:microsomal signal peptidase 12 kDa subunit [Schizosaccharomyces cryophilus OY26]EPY53771.1 microsomal signal peptidase 12 kDa subunit [Schizosaccharomyces cryophilus OY26]